MQGKVPRLMEYIAHNQTCNNDRDECGRGLGLGVGAGVDQQGAGALGLEEPPTWRSPCVANQKVCAGTNSYSCAIIYLYALQTPITRAQRSARESGSLPSPCSLARVCSGHRRSAMRLALISTLLALLAAGAAAKDPVVFIPGETGG